MKELSVKQLFELKKTDFVLSKVTNEGTLDKLITDSIVHRPGLALAGFYQKFPYQRLQILGDLEITYLQTLTDDVLDARLREIMIYDIPCFIVSKGLTVPYQMEFIANELKIAILSSRLSTNKLITECSRFLRDFLKHSIAMHATLVGVYGVGILISGKSGIGKSECALELIERGHVLIADDMAEIKSNEINIVGNTPANLMHYMEIRGVGIIDIERMFGIHAVRKYINIEIQVELLSWQENMEFERTGLSTTYTEILGIKIPLIKIPVSPGKNVAVIIEVIAMNYLLKTYGYEAAQNMQKNLQETIKNKSK